MELVLPGVPGTGLATLAPVSSARLRGPAVAGTPRAMASIVMYGAGTAAYGAAFGGMEAMVVAGDARPKWL